MDVKALREKLQMTQQELADNCGVTVRTVQNWEDGRKIPVAMMKLLKNIEDSHEIISSFNQDKSVNAECGNGNTIHINADTERIFAHLERQQDIMSRQLEEIVEMRKLAQKKDEQIDVLLKMIQSAQQSAE